MYIYIYGQCIYICVYIYMYTWIMICRACTSLSPEPCMTTCLNHRIRLFFGRYPGYKLI